MITWNFQKFEDLTPHELYAILQLRTEVFVVEQNCVFQDMDGKDHYCHHIMGWNGSKLIATARIVPPGISYEFPSIGRVVTSPSARGQNAGRELMNKSIEALINLYGNSIIRIGAQLYLKKFYESFGFEQSSAIYDEDGIDHIQMTRSAGNPNLL
jgi:ElaA protein